MKLKKLTMFNFMPYKGEAVLEFPQDEVLNTLIVHGDNMRGKTSLLNAIRWTFYGYAFARNQRKVPLQELPNKEAAREGNWHMETRIEFEANGSNYILRRAVKKNDLVFIPTRPQDFQVVAYLQKDGIAIPGSNINMEINKCAPEQVSRFFLFDGELLDEYETLVIEGNEQGKKIKDEIEKILGVPALTNGRDDIKIILKQAQKQQSIEARQIQGLEKFAERHQQWVSKRESYESDQNILVTKLSDTQNTRQGMDEDLQKVESLFVQKAELDRCRLKLKKIEEDKLEKSTQRLLLASQVWRDLLEPRLLLKRESIIQEQENLLNTNNQKNRLQIQIEQATQFLKDLHCPTCDRPLESDNREAKEMELLQLKNEMSLLNVDESRLTDISVQLRALNKIIGNGVGKQLSIIDSDLARFEFELTGVDNEIESLDRKLEGSDTDSIMILRARRDMLIREEARLNVEINQNKAKIDQADKEIRVLSQQMQSGGLSVSTRAAKMVGICDKLHSAFTNSIEHLRDSLRQSVEIQSTKAFKSLTTQAAYAGLQINDNYGLTILDQDLAEVTMRSSGAEQVVALSLIAGLSQVGRSIGPVLMDTPFARLDLKHRANILAYFPSSASQFVLFVHDGEIRDSKDLEPLAHRIGAQYKIREISPSHSTLEKI